MAQALFCLQIIVPCIETKPFTVKKAFSLAGCKNLCVFVGVQGFFGNFTAL